jgi:branched-chain amino acid transport system permease protein
MALQLTINGISIGAIYALIAVGFAVVFNIMRFSNFAHGGMISACAFISFFFQRAFDPPPPFFVTVLFSAVCGMGIALLIDTLGYRRIRLKNSPKIYYFLMSLTFAILIEQILTVFFGTDIYGFPSVFKSQTFEIGSMIFKTMNIVILAVSVVILVALVWMINKTKIGLAIRAVAINADTSRLMGINSSVIVTVIFIIAGVLAGVSGVFLGVQYGVFPSVGPSMMLKGFIASIIGGLGSLSGAIFAALALGLIEMFLTFFIGATEATVILFGIMLAFLFIRPQGIMGIIVEDKA